MTAPSTLRKRPMVVAQPAWPVNGVSRTRRIGALMRVMICSTATGRSGNGFLPVARLTIHGGVLPAASRSLRLPPERAHHYSKQVCVRQIPAYAVRARALRRGEHLFAGVAVVHPDGRNPEIA